MPKTKMIRYGKVVPHPTIKFSTIKIEIEAEVQEGESPDEAFKIIKRQVMNLLENER